MFVLQKEPKHGQRVCYNQTEPLPAIYASGKNDSRAQFENEKVRCGSASAID